METSTGNIERCERCKQFIIAEQRDFHKCNLRVKAVKEIYLDWLNQPVQNLNQDSVLVAMGLDGYLYRLILCQHNPPHSLESRLKQHIWSPEDGTEPGSGFCQVPVWFILLSKAVW